ncbi:MAG: hypothetical protein WBL63_13795 [Candidatus Acidiferrum sp.]
MHQELSLNTAICADYDQVLTVCQKALEKWRSRREQIASSGLSGKEVADELLRLQADFAKAYSRLQHHKLNCELCLFVSKIGGHDFAGISNVVSNKKCPA